MTTLIPFRRRAEVDEEPLEAEVVEAAPPAVVEEDGPDEDFQPSKAREAVVAITSKGVPSRQRVAASSKWWIRQAYLLIPHLPMMLLRELCPITRGVGRLASRWAAWVHCAELAEAVKEAEKNERSKAQERLTKRRTARSVGSVLALLALAGGGTWLYFFDASLLALAGFLMVCLFDAIGRRGQTTPDNPFPVAPRAVLDGGVPLQQITATVLACFEREGFEPGSVSVAAPMTVDLARKEYRIKVKTADEIERKHVKAIERAVGARDGAIRNLGTGTASIRELVISFGDPLTAVGQPEFLESRSRSIAQPLDLGGSMSDVPFAIVFAGTHVAVVGATGSGKTKGAIWTIIDRLSACRDCVIWGCDLAQGPALPMWRGVIQRRALTPTEADEMLTAAIAEIDRRMGVLTALAEDDDPTNDADEWHPGLGPALVVVVDEFALLADFDGKGKDANGEPKPDLLGRVEQIVRTGRKVWVSVVLGTQKSGNSDFGSRIMTTQLGVKILLACAESDTVTLLGKDKRDAGWSPHLLAPSVEGDVRDAGKCFVESPAHRTPDVYRTYTPLTPAEVKRRAKQRIEDGLPTLTGRAPAHDDAVDAVDAVEVPPVLSLVEHVFAIAGNPVGLATPDLISRLADESHETTAERLAADLRPTGLGPTRFQPKAGAKYIRGYKLEDVRDAIQELS